jgi:formate-dependent phosphoribosylglycinamide formyltransferase (GAR transformylase)
LPPVPDTPTSTAGDKQPSTSDTEKTLGSETELEKDNEIPFTITDALGGKQVWERVEVFIGGTHMGTMIVSKTSPKASLELLASKISEYEYRLVGESHEITEGGAETLLVAGSGKISVKKNSTFKITQTNRTSNSIVISLLPSQMDAK